MATTDELRTVIDTYARCFSTGDREGWLALFAPDATVEDPVGAEVKTGTAQIGEFWDFVHSLSESLELRIIGPVKVVGHEAAFGQQAVTTMGGTTYGVDIIDVMTFDDATGLITSMRAFWDASEMVPLDE